MQAFLNNISVFIVLFIAIGCREKEIPLNQKEDSNLFSVDKEFLKTFNPNQQLITKVEAKGYNRVVILSTPIYAYFEKLNGLNHIVGLFNKSRLSNVPERIASVGEGAELDIEKIISLKPDLIICNSYQLDHLKSLSVNKLAVDEYLESNPVKRVSLLKLIAPIIGFKDIELLVNKYSSLYTQFGPTNQSVLKMDNHGGDWFQPGCDTYIAQIIKAAGATSVCYKKSSLSEKVSHEEAVLALGSSDLLFFIDWADSKAGIKTRLEGVLSLTKHPKAMIYCNAKASDFFQESALNSHLIIADLNKVLTSKGKGVFFEYIPFEK